MAITRNRLVDALGVVALVIVGTIVWMQLRGGEDRVKAGPPMQKVPSAMPEAKGADQDTPAETLATVVTSNRELRQDVQRVLEENERLREDLKKGSRPSAPAATESTAAAGADPSGPADKSVIDIFGDAFDKAKHATSGVIDTLPGSARPQPGVGAQQGSLQSGVSGQTSEPSGAVSYRVVTPMGYSAVTSEARGRGGAATTTYVRTSTPGSAAGGADGDGPATRAAQAALSGAAAPGGAIPYFTLPENSTLAGVTSMTSLIGRVPVDGRVTDPMQFKAVVGKDNLAANGFELPDDLAGVIVSGVAIGDMALSCSEGKVRSLTFVFNDGTVRTVSARSGASADSRPAAGNADLGYISDLYGNPCVQGKFVTNAPAYLTDIIGVKSLEVAGQAYAEAQRTVQSNLVGGTTSTITGSVGRFALGNAVSGASDEVSKWLLSRLKNSFDAVVTPAGQQLVVHLDQEIRIDKNPNGRRLVHRMQSANLDRGNRYGLE